MADEICNNYLFTIFSEQAAAKKIILYVSLLLLQMIASPIQAGFSDFYCRKKSLVVSLSCSCLSLIFAFIFEINLFISGFIFVLMIFAKGGLGNTLPLSLAGVSDTQSSNVRFSFGMCTAAMASGYLALILLEKLFRFDKLVIMLILIFIILIIICAKSFKDIRDKEGPSPHQHSSRSRLEMLKHDFNLVKEEISMIINELSHKRTRKALTTFLLWEISLYSIHMLDVDLQIDKFYNLTTSMVLGYLIGIYLLKKLNKLTDKKMISIGYKTCIFSVIPFFILFPLLNDSRYLMLFCYFFYNMGTVFLAPSLFSTLANERKPHEQGKMFGLLESTDTVSFLFAAIAAIFYNISRLPAIYIVSFSFLTFLASWVPYDRFNKLKPRHF